MEIPRPVDLGPLQALLAKSKQVMNKVETDKPLKPTPMTESYTNDASYGDYDTDSFEHDEKEMVYENYNPTQYDPTNIQDYTEEQVMSSKLPEAIKEAMLKNRIPRLQSPPSKFTAEDISRITGAPIRKPKTMVNESKVINNNPDMITISKTELKDMINEGISTFFKQIYDKTITEETIKKTINLLIKEGKINVKKK